MDHESPVRARLSREDWSKIRICHVIPGEESGSSMIFSKRDVAEVRRAGLSTKTFFLKTRTQPIRLAQEWRRLARELTSFRPHIVHAHYGTMTACLTVLVARTPTVVTFHSAEFEHEQDISWLREKSGRLLSRFAATRSHRIICVTEEFKRRLSWCAAKVSVIPSSVELDLFAPQDQEAARATLGWRAGEPIVLFYKGRNPATKRLDRALATIELARRRHGPIRLEILDGSIDPARMPIYLNAADCLLCTSDSEGSPTIIKEAMACNLPIVSVDVGDVRRRLAQVQNCLIRERDPAALAEGVVRLLRSGQRSDGRHHLTDVSNHACRDRLLEVYRSLLQESHPQW